MNQSIKSGVTAGVLALAIVSTAAPTPTVYAQTTSDLQAQIQMLLAQIQQLQTQTSLPTAQVNLARDLRLGMSGADVQALQRFLNADPATAVAGSGVGSKGNETQFFGPATQAAVVKYQNKHRAAVLTPSGLTQGTGFVGPATRAHMNSTRPAITAPTPSTPTVPSAPKPNTPNTPSKTESVLQGEGSLDTFEIEVADDESISEAAADAPIATLTLEATDGDLELSRMDISLVADSGNDEKDPWDVFEDVSLWVNDKKIASRKIDNKSDYQNRTAGTIRFTGLNLILEEDEEMEITLAASVQNGVDGAGESANWSVKVDSVRYADADGVVVTDTATDELTESVSFEIVERGDGEELKFKTASNNPAEKTIIVDDRSRTNNVTILEYAIEALGGDIELDTLYVNVKTGNAAFNDVVSDIRLKVGNKTFKKDKVVTTGDYTSTSSLVSFDIDNKVTIDEDDEEDVSVIIDFKAKTAYQNGETIFAQVTSAERDRTEAEGADDVEEFSGSIIGKVQTLIAEGIFVPTNSVKMSTKSLGSDSNLGEYNIEFTINAVEGDFYLTDQTSTSSLSTLGGIQFSVESTVGEPTSVSASISSTAREDTAGVFTIREGRSETFTLFVVVDAASAGQHRVALDALQFTANANGITDSTTYAVTPKSQFRTPYQFISN